MTTDPHRDLMVDIETLGPSPRAVITQIGACRFDRTTGAVGATLLVNVSIQDGLDHGLVVDGDTLRWWFAQPPSCYTFLDHPVPLTTALQRLRDLAAGAEAAWAHATFDFPILAHAYRAVGQRMGLPYRTLRDLRTLVALADAVAPSSEETPRHTKDHNALNDCLYQVAYCVDGLRRLRGTPTVAP